MQNDNVGAYFREIRKRRELGIEQVRGNLHQSTISHFERDHDDITVRNLLQILQPTFTTPEEFCLLINGQDESISSILKNISEYYDQLDIAGLRAFSAAFEQAHPMTAPVRLILLILESCVKELAGEDPFCQPKIVIMYKIICCSQGNGLVLSMLFLVILPHRYPVKLTCDFGRRC